MAHSASGNGPVTGSSSDFYGYTEDGRIWLCGQLSASHAGICSTDLDEWLAAHTRASLTFFYPQNHSGFHKTWRMPTTAHSNTGISTKIHSSRTERSISQRNWVPSATVHPPLPRREGGLEVLYLILNGWAPFQTMASQLLGFRRNSVLKMLEVSPMPKLQRGGPANPLAGT